MAIPESQLETWTHIGAAAQSSATYQSIKGVIQHKDAPYATRRIDSFPAGVLRQRHEHLRCRYGR